MKIEILCVFLLITCFEKVASASSLEISAAAAGECTGSTYTFTLTGAVTGDTTQTAVTLTATTNPVTTATCTLPSGSAAGAITISCSASSVEIDGNYVISALARPNGDTVLSADPTISGVTIASVKCPASNEPDDLDDPDDPDDPDDEPSVASTTFTASSIGTGTCGNDGVYTFNVNGQLSAATASAISITPTFTSPTSSPTCTCSLPITATANIASAKIECKVTSALSSATITIGSMTGTGVTIKGLPQTMTGTATCAGKTDSGNEGGNNDSNANLIHLSKMLILAFFFLF